MHNRVHVRAQRGTLGDKKKVRKNREKHIRTPKDRCKDTKINNAKVRKVERYLLAEDARV